MIPSFMQRLISIHIMVLLNGRALLHYRRSKQRIIVPEIGLGPPRNMNGHSGALSFLEMFINVQGFANLIQYQNSDLD